MLKKRNQYPFDKNAQKAEIFQKIRLQKMANVFFSQNYQKTITIAHRLGTPREQQKHCSTRQTASVRVSDKLQISVAVSDK